MFKEEIKIVSDRRIKNDLENCEHCKKASGIQENSFNFVSLKTCVELIQVIKLQRQLSNLFL